jgi:serine/threonine-protein kinase
MPEKIGRYEITGELGKGAMGVVYKATDPTIGRTVALKTVRVDIQGTEHDDSLRRFQNEARAAGALNHPNIVTIYDAGEENGIFYIAMEYIAGRTLAQLLADVHAVSTDQVINVGIQICAGLDYAHIKKVVHRDIKPANIMIAADGTVKIMDFGIAKAGASLTHTGEVLGTPNYMSPEQVRGRDLDGRSDLFSTGVILYEMVTGERPFTGQNVTTVIYKIIHEAVVPPRELDVSIHPGLSAIICKCLSKDPDERYQSGADLATALKSYKIISLPERQVAVAPVAGPSLATKPATRYNGTVRTNSASTAAAAKPALAQPGSVPSPQRNIASRSPFSRRTVVVAAVLMIMVLGAAVAFWMERSKARPTPATAEPPVTPAKPTVQSAGTPPDDAVGRVADELSQPAAAVASKEKARPPVKEAGIGTLRVTSNPPGAQVTIDGVAQEWYVTPFNTPPMKSGTHAITAQLPGLGSQTKQVELESGEKITVDFQLASDKAIYNIGSAPGGAEIYVDGIDTQKTTPAGLTITPGQHKIQLRLEGFAPYEVTTDAGAGQTMNLSPTLRARNSIVSVPSQADAPSLGGVAKLRRFYESGEIPEGMGVIQIRTRPRGVTITIDGRTLPRVTPFKLPVAAGTHKITLQKDGYQPLVRTIQVDAGQISEIEELLSPQ